MEAIGITLLDTFLMIIDDIQPEYDVEETHIIRVRATLQEAYDAVKEIKPSEIAAVMRWLI